MSPNNPAQATLADINSLSIDTSIQWRYRGVIPVANSPTIRWLALVHPSNAYNSNDIGDTSSTRKNAQLRLMEAFIEGVRGEIQARIKQATTSDPQQPQLDIDEWTAAILKAGENSAIKACNTKNTTFTGIHVALLMQARNTESISVSQIGGFIFRNKEGVNLSSEHYQLEPTNTTARCRTSLGLTSQNHRPVENRAVSLTDLQKVDAPK